MKKNITNVIHLINDDIVSMESFIDPDEAHKYYINQLNQLINNDTNLIKDSIDDILDNGYFNINNNSLILYDSLLNT